MTFCSFFLLWLHAALSLDQWRIVDGRGAVQVVWGAPQLSAEQRAEVRTAWVWSERRAPRKVAPERIGIERFRDDAARLAVRVVRRAEGRPPADLRVIAAPAEMWAEIPEGSLPTWRVPADGRLAIPLDPARPWRLRVAGRGEGSWWVEARPGQSAVLLASSPAPGIDLAVLDPEGNPVAAVHASLQSLARGGMVQTWAGVLGNAGRIEVPGLSDEREVAVAIHHPLAAPFVLRGRPGALPRQVRLARAAEVVGRVAGLGGIPLAGVAVEAETWTSSEVPEVYQVRTTSDGKGAWHLRGLPPGKVAVTLRAPGFVPLRETFEMEAGTKDLGLLALETGTNLDVLVVDDAGAPVPGAQVMAGQIMARQGLSVATADGQGVARIAGLPVAPVQVRGTARRHLMGEARFNPPFPSDARLVLKRALNLTGRLVEPAGTPVHFGLARIDSGTCQSEARIEDGGRFDLDVPPDTRGEIVLRSPVTRELRVRLEPGEPGEVRDLGDLMAPAGLAVIGRVAAEGGGPVPGARVWTTRQGPDGPSVAWATRDLLAAVTDEEGRFRVTGLVPAAPAVLRIDAAGFARSQVQLPPEPPADDSGTLDLGTVTLRGGASVHVRVDPQTVPAEGAVARVDLGNRWLDPDLLTAAVLDGEAVIPNVPAGMVTVSVLAGRRLLCGQMASVPEEGMVDVECRRPPLEVTGQVLSGGVPAGAGLLTWQVPSQVPARIDTVVSPAGLRQQQVAGLGMPQVDVAVGADGRFRTGDLMPGRWQVTWRAQQGSATGEIIVEVPQVEHFDTVLPFAGLGVTGQVVDRNGDPAEGARVREMGSGALAFADADGRFSLPGLLSGKALVQAQLRNQTSELVTVELQPEREPEPVRLVLGDARPPAIETRVVDANGAPVAGAFVFLEEEGKGQRLVTTDADGRATVTLEPPLPARVRAAAFGAGAWGFGPWVSREEAEQGFTVQASGGGALTVESENRQGSPRIVTQDGWDLSWLFRQLGAPPVLTANQPFQMTGLPAGTYSISLDGASLTLQVTPEQPAEGRLE